MRLNRRPLVTEIMVNARTRRARLIRGERKQPFRSSLLSKKAITYRGNTRILFPMVSMEFRVCKDTGAHYVIIIIIIKGNLAWNFTLGVTRLSFVYVC